MKRVSFVIFACFIVLTAIFHCLGGTFDKQFWLGFLPGLMENLAILAVAVLVFEQLSKHERLNKLEKTNARQSQFVQLITNRLADWVLEHLGLATQDELTIDKEVNFEFARTRIGTVDRPKTFYEQLMRSPDREAFAEKFVEILRREQMEFQKPLITFILGPIQRSERVRMKCFFLSARSMC